jgi:hypothetical protein
MTDESRRKRDPPPITKEFGTARCRSFRRILPITIWSNKLVLNLFFDISEQFTVRAIYEIGSLVVRREPDLSEDLYNANFTIVKSSYHYPHLQVFDVPFARGTCEVQ